MVLKICYIVFAYICGAVPFSFIIAKVFGKVDIRVVGSGNPGATNVFRSVGKTAGIFAFILDVLKGFIPVYFAIFIDSTFSYSVIIAASAMSGHVWTVFLTFKGGKGVATGLGVCLALVPMPSIFAFAVFLLVFLTSGYVALGSICASLSIPLACYFFGYRTEPTLFAFAAAVLVIYKHKANIKRLKDGKENRFNVFKRKNKSNF
ncbi:MAG: glycerol-3-phosphate 1-O-acyltransferase PlsY [Elusimicrobiota bacterium]|jgi:glycerol-3-phosphate acyltransferase PlsY|nr:glycerol-3-phosphate 1-O-acyltransferase PlsY [Elusimicrobiota bacterium]